MTSWLDQVKQQFIIVTGDGKSYEPNWMNASFSVEYNVSQFNFRNLSGTLVDRQQPLGAVYDLEIIFQGDYHLTISQDFRKSAANKKPWTIRHPLYGQIYVQPIATLTFDNPQNRANTTTITGSVMETIGKSKLTITTSAPDAVSAAHNKTVAALNSNYASNVPAPSTKDIAGMRNNAKSGYGAVSGLITADADAANFLNTYNSLTSAINNAFADVSAAITGIQTLLALPATFADSVANRVNFMQYEFNSLLNQIASLSIPSLKCLWQNNAGTCMSAMCLASTYSIQPSDYVYATDATSVIAIIAAAYNSFLTSLDSLQTNTGADEDGFIPDVESILQLDTLVNYTIATLLTIATGAKQQRIFALTKDNNWIDIAYQLYGLVADDSTITQVMNDNNVGPDGILQAFKGQKIIYYV